MHTVLTWHWPGTGMSIRFHCIFISRILSMMQLISIPNWRLGFLAFCILDSDRSATILALMVKVCHCDSSLRSLPVTPVAHQQRLPRFQTVDRQCKRFTAQVLLRKSPAVLQSHLMYFFQTSTSGLVFSTFGFRPFTILRGVCLNSRNSHPNKENNFTSIFFHTFTSDFCCCCCCRQRYNSRLWEQLFFLHDWGVLWQ